MVWTPETVKELLEEAADTVRRLSAAGTRPAQIKSAMPDVVQNYWDVFGKREQGPVVEDDERPRLAPPAIDAIDRLETALPMIYSIKDAKRRKIVWAVASGMSRRKVAQKTGRHRNTIARIFDNECERLADQTNRAKKNSATCTSFAIFDVR